MKVKGQKSVCMNINDTIEDQYDWLYWIKEYRNHFHLFILGPEDPLYKDKSWPDSQL